MIAKQATLVLRLAVEVFASDAQRERWQNNKHTRKEKTNEHFAQGRVFLVWARSCQDNKHTNDTKGDRSVYKDSCSYFLHTFSITKEAIDRSKANRYKPTEFAPYVAWSGVNLSYSN